jgi:gluconokinase
MRPSVIMVMGVSGSGKSTVGRALADALGAEFLEADAFHSPANIERMREGIPLDDAARQPWLLLVRAAVLDRVKQGRSLVFACSALKVAYRHTLLDGIDDAIVVYLAVDRSTLEERLRTRRGHFMPASLLASQLADLEPPADAIVVDEGRPLPEVIDEILARLDERG